MKRRALTALLAAAGIVLAAVQTAPMASAVTPVAGTTSGPFEIKFDNSGMCLDDPNSATTPGTALEQWACNGGSNQYFYLDYVYTYGFRIRNEASGLCVNIKGDVYTDNTPIILWPCLSVGNENFQFQQAPLDQPPYSWNWIEGYENNSMVLNVNKASTAEGAKIILYSISDSTNEFARIISPPAPPPAPQAPICQPTNPADWRLSSVRWDGPPKYSDWVWAYLGALGDVEAQYQWGDGQGSNGGRIWIGTGPCAGLGFDEQQASMYRLRFMDDDCHCELIESRTGWLPITGAPVLNSPEFGDEYVFWNPIRTGWFSPLKVYASPPP